MKKGLLFVGLVLCSCAKDPLAGKTGEERLIAYFENYGKKAASDALFLEQRTIKVDDGYYDYNPETPAAPYRVALLDNYTTSIGTDHVDWDNSAESKYFAFGEFSKTEITCKKEGYYYTTVAGNVNVYEGITTFTNLSVEKSQIVDYKATYVLNKDTLGFYNSGDDLIEERAWIKKINEMLANFVTLLDKYSLPEF